MDRDQKRIAVIGGGFSGTLLALKLSAAKAGWDVLLVEDSPNLGHGLAYGACAPRHLLNVPVCRLDVGLKPSFSTWLRQHPGLLGEALEECRGDLAKAYVPRRLFGDYMQQQVREALGCNTLAVIHSRAVAISEELRRLHLADGRSIDADAIVLATGHFPARLPFRAKPSRRVISDPWATGLHGISPDAKVLLIGTGLTMIDMVVSLKAQRHRAPIQAVSRHGLLPRAHQDGGSWPPFLNLHASPLKAFRAMRAAARRAEGQGIPWQRVFDAVRPVAALLWHGWSIAQRAQFLRHLRALWDVHRHRMAGRIAAEIGDLIAGGALKVGAGRILALDEHKDGVTLLLKPRGGRSYALDVDVVINCTGPRTDLQDSKDRLLNNLVSQDLIQRDSLGLGLESEDCAVKDGQGAVSDWIYALGPLTRPAWWEITAVPEIAAQIDRLVRRLSAPRNKTARVFVDLGAGI